MSARPAFGYSTAIFRGRDPWTYSCANTGWSHVYDQLRPGPFDASTQLAWLGPIQLVHETVGTAFKYHGHAWPGARVFFSYVSDQATRYYDCYPILGDTVVSHRWDAVERVVSPRAIQLAVIAIDESYLTNQFATLFEQSRMPSLPTVTCTSDPRRVRLFQACVVDVLHELEQHPQLIDEPMARAEFRARVIDTLAEIASDTATGRHLPPPTTRAYVVRRATEIIEARIADVISVADLCSQIGVCPRTLRYSFEEVTGVSPTQYLLSMRLNGARRELSNRDTRSSVQVVAARWGFWHMSRFARYYRQAFGERPSDTVAAAVNRRHRCRSLEQSN